MSRHWRSILVVFFAIIFMTSAFAETAKVVGTIRNTDYDPLAGYSVALRDVNTKSVVSTLTTGADGKYSFGFVQPGTYVLVITKDGQDVKTSDSFDVEVGATVPQNVELDLTPPAPPVQPPTVTPAQTTTTTTNQTAQQTTPATTPGTKPAGTTLVAEAQRCENNPTDPKCRAIYCSHHSEAAVCQMPKPQGRQMVRNDTNTSISAAITREQLQSLPLYNRNFLVLGGLTPNTHEVEASSTLRGGSFSISGVRAASNSFLLDGIDNNAGSTGQAIPFQVNDSIREFRVTSAGAGAEYGRNSGGTIDIVTQRATANWHGGAYGYFGSDSFNGASKVSVYNGTTFDKAASFAGAANQMAPTVNTIAGITVYAPQTYNQYATTTGALGYCSNPLATTLASCNPQFDPTKFDNGKVKAPFSSKQFGSSIGGPVKKDKLYFFGSYEGTRIDNPNSIFERVPSSFDRGSQSLAGFPQAQTWVPQTFSGFQDVASSYAIAQNLMNLYPLPNRVAVPGALEFYRGTAPNYTNVDNLLVRGDWNLGGGGSKGFSRRHTVTARYTVQHLNQLHDDTLPEQVQYAGNGANRGAVNQSASLAVTSFLSPKASNDLRLGTNRFQVIESPQDANFNPTSVGLRAGAMPTFFLAGLDPQYSGLYCDPSTLICSAGAVMGWQDVSQANGRMLPYLDGQFPMARLGAPLTAPSRHRDTGGFVTDQMGIQAGRHALKFGGEFRLYQNQYTSGGQTRGFVNSANIGQFAADSESCFFACGSSNTAFLYPSFDYRIQQPSDYRGLLKSFATAGFFQDTFNVSEKLTINMGIRYEYFSVPNELHNQIFNFDPVANGLVKPGLTTPVNLYGSSCPVTGTVPNFMVPSQWTGQNLGWKCSQSDQNGLYPENRRDFAPRIGFAYSLGKKAQTVIRGSYGLYFDQQPAANLEQMLLNRPNPYNVDNPEALYGSYYNPFNCSASGFCGGVGNSTLVGSTTSPIYPAFQSASVPGVIYAKDYDNSKTPYVQQLSGSVQHLLNNNLGLEVGYVGTYGSRLPVVVNTNFENEWFCHNKLGTGTSNPCDPFSFSPIFTQTNQGRSEYHSLLVRARGNWSRFSLNATYTYSKSMDNVASSSYPTLPVTAMANIYGFQLFGTGVLNYLQFGGFRQGFSSQVAGAASVPTVLPDFSSAALTTTGAGQIFTTPYNISQNPLSWQHDDWGRSDFNAASRFVMDFNYKFGRKNSLILSDWQISSIVTGQTGQPYTIFSSMFGEVTQRANQGFLVESRTTDNWIGLPASGINNLLPSQSAACTTGTLGGGTVSTGGYVKGVPFQGAAGTPCTGDTPRNSFTGPIYLNTDLALQKQVRFKNSESRMLTFRTEFYNMFNRANYYNPISVLSYDGQTVNPDFGKIKSAHSPFQMQLAVRFSF